MSHNIDHIFYINIAHRTDRLSEIENELCMYDLSSERFEAICLNSNVSITYKQIIA